MAKVGIGTAIAGSFRFVAVAWRRAWGIMLAVVAVAALIRALELLRPDLGLLGPVGLILLTIAGAAAAGALFRVELEQDHPGDPAFRAAPAGVQWGGLEWRVLQANVIFAACGIVAIAVVAFVWALALGVSAASRLGELHALTHGASADRLAAIGLLMQGPGGVVTAVIVLPAFVALVYLAARLLLYSLTAADTGSLDPAKAWPVTRGAVWTIVVAAVVLILAQLAAGVLAGGVAGLLAAIFGQGLDGGRLWGGVAGQAVGAALTAPLFAGLQLCVYRRSRGDRGAVQAAS